MTIRTSRLGVSLSLAAACFLGAVSFVRAAYPEFNMIKPNGAQRGSTTQVTISGTHLADFDGFIFVTPGLTLKSINSADNSKVVATINVAPDVPLGAHLMRLRTKTGVSHARQFFVGPFPNVEEKEPNNDLETAQEVSLYQTVEGVVQNEDVDFFKIHLKKDQRLSIEIDGLRLGYTNFDPYISILNKDKFELAFSDDTILHRQDGYCSIVAPAEADYFIQVRESSYRGSGRSFYRLHIGDFRRPDVVYPAGGKAGSTQKVRFIESNGNSFEEDVKVPAALDPNFMLFSQKTPAPSGNPFHIVNYENVMEVEPNDSIETATPCPAGSPIALNGIIEKPGDMDYYKVPFKKGEKVDVKVYAQALGSPLDSVLTIMNEKGNVLISNDDGGGRRRLDSKATFTAPKDGEYYVRISDHLDRGGPNFVYRVELTATEPDFYFASPQFVVNDTHSRQFIAVAKGNRYATVVNITRNNIGGDSEFEVPNLPAGVKLLTGPVPKDATSMPLLFEAAPDAPIAGTTVPIALKLTDPAQTMKGTLRQEFDVVRDGNTIYYTQVEDRLPVVVTEEVPYTLEIEKPKVSLVNNGLLDLRVVAKRKEGFKAPIRVFMLWKPPGVSCLGELGIEEGKDECHFTLDASGAAPAGKWQFTVLGEAEGGNGRVYAASPFCEVTTTPAFLSAPAIPLAAVEQGKEIDVVCKLELAQPFEGEAEARFVGMPDTIPVDPIKINKDTKEAVFHVRTDAKSPLGKQGSLFVQVNVPVPGGAELHRIAMGSSLRVDQPRKVTTPAAAPKPQLAQAKPKEEPKPAAPKTLSRLEQLRQEAAADKK